MATRPESRRWTHDEFARLPSEDPERAVTATATLDGRPVAGGPVLRIAVPDVLRGFE